jgi:HD superfamily phosphodiesterase
MLTTERLIKNAENKWLVQLQDQCRNVFKEVHLPSHDETHHTRVWFHAKELLLEMAKKGQTLNEKDVEMLIIAIFFHDTGMSQTLQKDHGKISRGIAKDFLKNKDIHGLELEEILDAIEYHDNKDYITTKNEKGNCTLQSLLNICDDLDALSNIGVYRYFEIYSLRNIDISDISDAVLDNLQKRFQHMKAFLDFSPNYQKEQNHRYATIRNFYKDLNFQVKQAGEEITSLNGPLGVINFLKEFIFNQKLHLKEAVKSALLISGDGYVTNFFEKLEKEA